MPKGRRLNPDFWANVDVRGPDECWPWKFGKNPSGYGVIHLNGKTEYTHRRAYQLTHGAIPDELYVCHACDHPPCCNPAHLWAGTPRENTIDCYAKGRNKRAGRKRERPLIVPSHPCLRNAKVTRAQVAEIRAIYAAGGITMDELGGRYGLTGSGVHRIIRGSRWKEAI